QIFDVVIRHRGERDIHVFETVRIFFDPLVDAPNPAVQNGEACEFADGFEPILRIELPDRLKRQTGPPIAPELETKYAALERMHAFEMDRAHEPHHENDRVSGAAVF